MACMANTLAGCCKVENPSGMTPVETVQKYFYYWNAKSDRGMSSLEYKGMPKGDRELYYVNSVKLNSCTQDENYDKSGWPEPWYQNPYDCARVYADFTIDTKDRPSETYTYTFYLVKESKNADWIIAMYGQG